MGTKNNNLRLFIFAQNSLSIFRFLFTAPIFPWFYGLTKLLYVLSLPSGISGNRFLIGRGSFFMQTKSIQTQKAVLFKVPSETNLYIHLYFTIKW